MVRPPRQRELTGGMANLYERSTMDESTAVRFWAKVDIREPGECWTWRGKPNDGGYGLFGLTPSEIEPGLPRIARAHRVAFRLANGEIDGALDIDHACHNRDSACPGGLCAHRLCCNPTHLDNVTRRENLIRSPHALKAGWEYMRGKTHCPQGHPYDVANTYHTRNGRSCRTCSRTDSKRYKSVPHVVQHQSDHCHNGHEFTPENTSLEKNGGRFCRACKRAATARFRAKQRKVSHGLGA